MRERMKDIYGEYLLGFTQEMFPVFVPLWKNKTVSLQVPHEAWLDQPPAAKSNRAKSADTKAAEIQRISAALVCYQVFALQRLTKGNIKTTTKWTVNLTENAARLHKRAAFLRGRERRKMYPWMGQK